MSAVVYSIESVLNTGKVRACLVNIMGLFAEEDIDGYKHKMIIGKDAFLVKQEAIAIAKMIMFEEKCRIEKHIFELRKELTCLNRLPLGEVEDDEGKWIHDVQ